MKSISTFLNEAVNRNSMFMGKVSKRTAEDFSFSPGEKVILIKYTTHHYEAQPRGVYEINRVNGNSISLKGDEFYKSLKFDVHGICVKNSKNKYTGNSTDYWVLYNAALVDDNDIQELLSSGSNMWGFKFPESRQKEVIAELQKYVDELKH